MAYQGAINEINISSISLFEFDEGLCFSRPGVHYKSTTLKSGTPNENISLQTIKLHQVFLFLTPRGKEKDTGTHK